eukprot:6606823-Pyramimonas_sp.AAC.1
MATSLSVFSARLLSKRAASPASPVCSSCTSGATAPAFTVATRWESLCLVRCINLTRASRRRRLRANLPLVRTTSTRDWMILTSARLQ